MKIFKKKLKGFTLVELIVVITILAILSTISFISVQNYIKDSRDANRLATLSNIQQALEIYYLQTRLYPNPDWETASWYIIVDLIPEQLTEVWIIWDNISRILNFSKTPIDPISNTNYMYWVSYNKRSYQLAATLETELTNSNFLLKNTYALNLWLKAKVKWTYEYPLKKWNKLCNLPSLLFTWNVWEFTNNTNFIVNNWYNIPYKLNPNNNDNSQDFEKTLKTITKNNPLLLSPTCIEIPAINSINIDQELNELAYILWESTEKIWIISYWLDNYLAKVKDNITIWNISDDLLAYWSQTDITITDYTNWCTTSDWKTWWDIFEWWNWTIWTPYQIKYDYQVDAIRCNLTANYKLISNINLVNYLPLAWNVYWAEWWLPIWNNYNYFAGKLDGDWYIILNIWINRPNYSHSTWFISNLASSWIVTNLNLKTKDIIWWGWTWWFVWWNEWDISYSSINITWNINWLNSIWWFAWAMNWDIVYSTVNITWNITWTSFVWWFIWFSLGEINNSQLTLNWNVIWTNERVWWFAWESHIIRNSNANITWNIEAWDNWTNSVVWWFVWFIRSSWLVENSHLVLTWIWVSWTKQRVWGFIGNANSSSQILTSTANITWNITWTTFVWWFVWWSWWEILDSNLTLNWNVIWINDKVWWFAWESQIIKNSNANITWKVQWWDDWTYSLVWWFAWFIRPSWLVENSHLVLTWSWVSWTKQRVWWFVWELNSSWILSWSTANITWDITWNWRVWGFIGIAFTSQINQNNLYLYWNIINLSTIGNIWWFIWNNNNSTTEIYSNNLYLTWNILVNQAYNVWWFVWNNLWRIIDNNAFITWNIDWYIELWWFAWKSNILLDGNYLEINWNIRWDARVWWYIWWLYGWEIKWWIWIITWDIIWNVSIAWFVWMSTWIWSKINNSSIIVNWNIEWKNQVWWFNWILFEWNIQNSYSNIYWDIRLLSDPVWKIGGFIWEFQNLNSKINTINNVYTYISWEINSNWASNAWKFAWIYLSDDINYTPFINCYVHNNNNNTNNYFDWWTLWLKAEWNWNEVIWNNTSNRNLANDYWIQDLTALDFLTKAWFDTNIWWHESWVNNWLPYLK